MTTTLTAAQQGKKDKADTERPHEHPHEPRGNSSGNKNSDSTHDGIVISASRIALVILIIVFLIPFELMIYQWMCRQRIVSPSTPFGDCADTVAEEPNDDLFDQASVSVSVSVKEEEEEHATEHA